MKTYLYVTPYFPSPTSWRGGYGYDFVKAVERTGRYRVEVFVEGGMEEYEVDGVRVHPFPVKRLPSNVLPLLWRGCNERSFLRAVEKAGVKAEEIAVCHGNTANFAVYALAAKKANPKCKALLHHHDLSSFGLRNGILRHVWPYNMIMFPKLRRLHEEIDLHVFISEACKRSFLAAPDTGWTGYRYYKKQMRGLPCRPARIKASYVLHNGVDRRVFTPEGRRGHDGFVIGCVGNFNELKDQMGLLKAVERLNAARANRPGSTTGVRVVFVGSGERRRKCEKYARAKGIEAEFRDEVRHGKLADFYRGIDLFVLPSFFEGFGCVYTEAWCCGTPFIACEGQGIEDVIFGEDRAKWLARARDPEDLAAKIAAYMENRWEQRLREDPDIDGLVGKFIEELEG